MHNAYTDPPALPPVRSIIQPTRRLDEQEQASVVYAPKHDVAFVRLGSAVPSRADPETDEGFSSREKPHMFSRATDMSQKCNMQEAHREDWTQKQHFCLLENNNLRLVCLTREVDVRNLEYTS